MIKNPLIYQLARMGTITQEQASQVLSAVSSGQIVVETYLLENKLATPTQIAQAYAQYAHATYIDKITDAMADPEVLAQVPLRYLKDNVIIPIVERDQITLVIDNPLKLEPLDQLRLTFGGTPALAVASAPVIIDAINRYYPLESAKQAIAELEEEEERELGSLELSDIEEKDIVAMAAEAPIIKLVNNILFQAVKRGASDIHIEPFEKEVGVRYRIDGVLYTVMTPPKRLQGALISRIKIMANLNIAEKRVPQDGRIDLKVAGRGVDIRVSVLPVVYGERIVMRLLDKSRTFGKLIDLGFSERDYNLIEESIKKPNGIIYVTGPTGSGKTTTLYSVLGELNNPNVNIITVEDPVEYQMPGVGQVAVREKIGMTFAAALRSILRQDPDIIMIGETRDFETAQIAIQASLTGHLVLSTLHTNSAPASITRLIDMGVEPYLIASSVVLIMAQRLVRKLCQVCKKPYHPTQAQLDTIGISSAHAQRITFYAPVGCPECLQTGYRGRIALFELMPMSNGIARLTMERVDTARITRQAVAEGMTQLIDDGIVKIEQGLTTIDEVLAVASSELDTIEPIDT